MRPPTRTWPWLLIIPLLILVAVTDRSVYEQNLKRDPVTKEVLYDSNGRPKYNYRPMNTLILHQHGETKVGLGSFQNLIPAVLLGFKSALADILWVKADGYFHTGRYERIMPLCHLITWLDPKFLEVYVIGAWHMAYNFMDRRYIPAGVEFLDKGIHNNPDDAELRFEQANMLHDKAQEFDRAAQRSREANDMDLQPAGKRHLLAHALEKAGRIDEAIMAWEEFIQEEEAAGNWQMANVSRHNRDLTIWRREARKLRAEDPLNVEFDIKWSIPKRRVVRIEGTTNLPELTKVNVQLRDKGYEQILRDHPQVLWQVANTSLYWDNFTVKDGKWSTWYKSGNLVVDRLDLGSEPAKYPLKSDEYEVVITINPRVEPIIVQDITGWDGEGITGPHVEEIDGVRMIRKVFTVTRAQLLGEKQVTLAD
ncbi:MAG TPA: hypothetical protein GX715_18020 [Armatimonadetes bacterium]|jgi:tetratricopeptide (TPR) repeat protein|nr:hypothetical protein [Armatimonadota bacterium]